MQINQIYNKKKQIDTSNMGTKVSYKSTRSGNEAGAEINDGNDFFQTLFDEVHFNEFQQSFQALSAAKQAQFLDVFDGAIDMDSNVTGNLWLTENDGDGQLL